MLFTGLLSVTSMTHPNWALCSDFSHCMAFHSLSNNVLYLDFDARINTGIQDNPTEEPMAPYLNTNRLRENRLSGSLISRITFRNPKFPLPPSTHSLCGGQIWYCHQPLISLGLGSSVPARSLSWPAPNLPCLAHTVPFLSTSFLPTLQGWVQMSTCLSPLNCSNSDLTCFCFVFEYFLIHLILLSCSYLLGRFYSLSLSLLNSPSLVLVRAC